MRFVAGNIRRIDLQEYSDRYQFQLLSDIEIKLPGAVVEFFGAQDRLNSLHQRPGEACTEDMGGGVAGLAIMHGCRPFQGMLHVIKLGRSMKRW